MIALHRISLTAAAASLLVAVFAFSASAQINRATFPADFDKYVLYATYDRGSSKEEAFAKPATLEIAKSGATAAARHADRARHLAGLQTHRLFRHGKRRGLGT